MAALHVLHGQAERSLSEVAVHGVARSWIYNLMTRTTTTAIPVHAYILMYVFICMYIHEEKAWMDIHKLLALLFLRGEVKWVGENGYKKIFTFHYILLKV